MQRVLGTQARRPGASESMSMMAATSLVLPSLLTKLATGIRPVSVASCRNSRFLVSVLTKFSKRWLTTSRATVTRKAPAPAADADAAVLDWRLNTIDRCIVSALLLLSSNLISIYVHFHSTPLHGTQAGS